MNEVLVYVVIIDDCSDDVDVAVFSAKEAAISRAKEILKGKNAGFGAEDFDCTDENTVFHVEYSTLGNSVGVVRRLLQ